MINNLSEQLDYEASSSQKSDITIPCICCGTTKDIYNSFNIRANAVENAEFDMNLKEDISEISAYEDESYTDNVYLSPTQNLYMEENENDRNDLHQLSASENIYMPDEEITTRMMNNTNHHTMCKYKWAFNKFVSWVKSLPSEVQPHTPLEDYTPTMLNTLISRFIIQCKTKNESKYKPKTLFELILALQQYINNKRQFTSKEKVHFLTDDQYSTISTILDYEMKERAKLGFGINRKVADIITEDMETSLWEKNILGTDTPEKLRNSLLYLIGLHFALRGFEEHVRLTISNFRLVEVRKKLLCNTLKVARKVTAEA